jgi:hypothetical protein
LQGITIPESTCSSIGPIATSLHSENANLGHCRLPEYGHTSTLRGFISKPERSDYGWDLVYRVGCSADHQAESFAASELADEVLEPDDALSAF